MVDALRRYREIVNEMLADVHQDGECDAVAVHRLRMAQKDVEDEVFFDDERDQ